MGSEFRKSPAPHGRECESCRSGDFEPFEKECRRTGRGGGHGGSRQAWPAGLIAQTAISAHAHAAGCIERHKELGNRPLA